MCKGDANQREDKDDTVIFILRFTCLPRRESPLRQAPRLPPVLLLVVTRKSHSPTWSAYHKLQHLTWPDHLSPFVSHSTRVALCGSRGVSTIPSQSLFRSTTQSSLRALMETTTKPSRRWKPPRVTSTTGLQLEHLVPLDATS